MLFRSQVSGDYEFQDMILSVLLKRPDFCPQSYELLWELQDNGWGEEPTLEDILSR